MNTLRVARRFAPPLAIAAAAIVAIAYLRAQRDSEVAAQRSAFLKDSHLSALTVKARVETTFHRLFDGLRTMSRLPGVQASLGSGAPLSADSQVSLQELYNSLASDVALSEIYVVPRDIDPDAAATAAVHREPLTTFDQLIVGRSLGGEPAAADSAAGSAEPELEEIEIFEYRAMREQFRWFAEHAARHDPQAGLSVPALLSAEVVTCDNSRYDRAHPDDRDRMGLVYTVPAFNSDGALIGGLSGVILGHALRDLLPDGHFAVHAARRGVLLGSRGGDDWKSSLAAVQADAPDATRIYSEVFALAVPDDDGGHWTLWCGLPDGDFAARPDVVAAATNFRRAALGIGAVAALLIAALLFGRTERRAARILAALDAIGEGRFDVSVPVAGHDVVGDLGRAVQRLVDRQGRSIGLMRASSLKLADAVARFTGATEEIRTEAESSDEQARVGRDAGDELARSIESVAAAVKQVNESAQGIAQDVTQTATVARAAAATASSASQLATRLEKSSREILDVVDMIRTVAFKTNLLALNASIEAARAGEQGRGFAVVASEVRALANQVSASAKEITQRVEAIGRDSEEVGRSLRSIGNVVHEIDDKQSLVAKTAAEQAASAQVMERGAAGAVERAAKIRAALERIGTATRTTAARASDVSHAAGELDGVAATLKESCTA